jgi:hypothetical protein
MAQAKLVRSPWLFELGEVAVVLAIVASSDGVGLSGIRFRNSGRDGNLWVGCPSFSHSMQGGWTRGGVELWAPSSFACPQLWPGG